jgi:hypothetical protein
MNIKKIMAPLHPATPLLFEDRVDTIMTTSGDTTKDLIKKEGEEVGSWRKELDRKKFSRKKD